MKYVLSILLFLAGQFAFPQMDTSYLPLTADSVSGIQQIKRKQKIWLAKVDGRKEELLSKAYQQRYKYLSYGFKNSHFLYGSPLQGFLDATLKNICASNPEIPEDEIFIIPTRDWLPNASSMGDGTILLNMGLLRRLDNESQLAFILCHEIAHFTLSHLEKTVEHQAEKLEDKSLKRNIKRSIRRGNYQDALGLLEVVIYDQRKNDRTQEAQADSLGMAYLANTDYDLHQALSCLELLDTIDEEKYAENINIKATFNTTQYPFKERWIEEEKTMFGGTHLGFDLQPVFNQDSLRTHPACLERKDTLHHIFLENILTHTGKPYLQDSAYFHQWVQAADFEIVEGLYQNGATAYALYQCLKLLKIYPDNSYLITMAGLCLLQVQEAMLNHQLEEYVPLPQRQFDKDFKQVCTFLHRLRLREIAALTYHYLKNNELRGASYPRFKKALELSHKMYRS